MKWFDIHTGAGYNSNLKELEARAEKLTVEWIQYVCSLNDTAAQMYEDVVNAVNAYYDAVEKTRKNIQ